MGGRVKANLEPFIGLKAAEEIPRFIAGLLT
jgi:hypothetical protein